MEHWRKTSCAEPLPLERRNNKRKLVVENKPDFHVHQQQVFKSTIDAAANLPCVHVDSKVCPKQMRKVIWSLWNEMRVEGGRSSELDLGDGSKSERLVQKKQVTTSTEQKTKDGYPGSRVEVNEDAKPEQQLLSRNVQQTKYLREKNEMRARTRVMNILHKFRDYCNKLSDKKRDRDILNEEGNLRRVDLRSAKQVKNELGYSTGKQYIGKVPGVEIGDRFYYRMELHIVGLHGPPRSGIETMDYAGHKIATSIVVSGGYNDYWKDDALIYCGHGGGTSASGSGGSQERAKDQKLKGGNLALLNSKRIKNPVRVIIGEKKTKAYYDQFPTTYKYDGLYRVEDMWKIRDSDTHKVVFHFKLIKIRGQT